MHPPRTGHVCLALSSQNSFFVLVLGVRLQVPYLTGLGITGLLLKPEKEPSLGCFFAEIFVFESVVYVSRDTQQTQGVWMEMM